MYFHLIMDNQHEKIIIISKTKTNHLFILINKCPLRVIRNNSVLQIISTKSNLNLSFYIYIFLFVQTYLPIPSLQISKIFKHFIMQS